MCKNICYLEYIFKRIGFIILILVGIEIKAYNT